ncbi:hypothetical protein NL676_036069 [Syzygium grande]|nr:hypothetical protein NL676_036069 [Syzygium grande]
MRSGRSKGTLIVAQVGQIILLHQGKADDHSGPTDILQIAEKFRVDVAHVQKILQFVSLPPEDSSKGSANKDSRRSPWTLKLTSCITMQFSSNER